jgi:hypothetical protein
MLNRISFREEVLGVNGTSAKELASCLFVSAGSNEKCYSARERRVDIVQRYSIYKLMAIEFMCILLKVKL